MGRRWAWRVVVPLQDVEANLPTSAHPDDRHPAGDRLTILLAALIAPAPPARCASYPAARQMAAG
jgi:hypothetical protein